MPNKGAGTMNKQGPGRPLTGDKKMVNLNTKVRPKEKAFLNALVKVGAHDNQREAIEAMIKIYSERYPERAAAVEKQLEAASMVRG
jgi:hypothetical protein